MGEGGEDLKMGNVLFLAFLSLFFYVNGKINANVSSLTDEGYSVVDRYICLVVTVRNDKFQH